MVYFASHVTDHSHDSREDISPQIHAVLNEHDEIYLGWGSKIRGSKIRGSKITATSVTNQMTEYFTS